MLKIGKADDPVEVRRLITCIYGQPGIGKTAAAMTAAAPLHFDFDAGRHRTEFRGAPVEIKTWADVEAVTPEDLEPYQTVVIDTVGRALDLLSAHLTTKDAKMRASGGGLSLQGYGALKSTFAQWLRKLTVAGKDVVLIAHSDEQKRGDDVLERLDIQGSSKGEVYKLADLMGRLVFEGQKRRFLCSPSDSAFGKNPCGLPPIDVPSFKEERWWLAGVLSGVKARLNERANQAGAAQAAKDHALNRIEAATTAEELNGLVADLQGADQSTKAALLARGKELGIPFDRQARSFVAPAPEQQKAANSTEWPEEAA